MIIIDTSVDSVQDKIKNLLSNHPEGLSIKEISNILGLHRQTISKYTCCMKNANQICIRRIGSAALHYTKGCCINDEQ